MLKTGLWNVAQSIKTIASRELGNKYRTETRFETEKKSFRFFLRSISLQSTLSNLMNLMM
jgi:hypothetical protein